MRVADSRIIGILPLQHFYDDTWDEDLRASVYGVRIVDRFDKGNPQHLGWWKNDKDGVGDIHGGQLFKRVEGKRAVSMFRHAWPVLTAKPASNDVITQTAQPTGTCAVMPGALEVSPILNEKWEPDDRFHRAKPTKHKDWPQFPVDWAGISLVSDTTKHQEDLFLPTDPRMVAVNVKGSAAMGSHVCDMGDDFKVDPKRIAKLQSFFRVIKDPLYCSGFSLSGSGVNTGVEGPPKQLSNIIAWNIGPTGCEDTRGGLMFEKRIGKGGSTPGGTPTPTPGGDPVVTGPPRTFSHPQYNVYMDDLARFGPGGAGAGVFGAPAGLPEMPPPPSTGTMPSSESGRGVIAYISHFDSGHTDVGDESDKHRIGKDADGHPINASHLSTNAYFKRPGTAQDAPLEFGGFYVTPRRGRYILPVYLRYDATPSHPFVCGPRKGLWRWEAECCVGSPAVPSTMTAPGVATQSPGVDPFDPPPGGPPGTPGGPGGNDVGIPAVNAGNRVFDFGGVYTDFDRPIQKWRAGEVQRYNAIEVALGVSAVLFRPQNLATGQPDLRLLNNRISPDAQRRADFNTPVTGRLEAFGYQRDGGWVNTQAPGSSRFGGGTSPGGFCLLPPELDMLDYLEDFSRDDVTPSTTYFNAVPGTYFSAGLPNPTTGQIKTAFRWGANTSGDLVFSGASAAGVITARVTMENGGRLVTTSNATYPALHIGAHTADPSTLVNGDVWRDSTTGKFRVMEDGIALNLITRWTRLYKAADEAVNTTVTPQADDELVGTLTAGITYRFRWHLFVTNAGAGGFRATINGSATLGAFSASITMFSNGTLVAADTITALGTEVAGNIGADGYCIIEGTMECTVGGTFQLQWAQSVSDGGDTTVTEGSDVEFVRF